MPARNHDLHGSAPDKCETALLLIDVINDLEFPEAEEMLDAAVEMAKNVRRLKQRESGHPRHLRERQFRQMAVRLS